jgi:hypothetical protein
MQEVVRERILRARRLLLFLLTPEGQEESRRAWEVLVGPVDWDRASRSEPQDNEPFPVRMIEPGTLLTVEGGVAAGYYGRAGCVRRDTRAAWRGAGWESARADAVMLVLGALSEHE